VQQRLQQHALSGQTQAAQQQQQQTEEARTHNSCSDAAATQRRALHVNVFQFSHLSGKKVQCALYLFLSVTISPLVSTGLIASGSRSHSVGADQG